MTKSLIAASLAAVLAIAVVGAQQAQQSPQREQPSATEDAVASGGNFPLAATAGQDSNAKSVAPRRRGEPGTVRHGHVEVRPRVQRAGGQQDLESGEAEDDGGAEGTGGTLFAASDPATYCAMANAGYDFIWTEMQHDAHDWEDVAKHVAHLPAREGGARRPRRLHRRARRCSTRSTPARSSLVVPTVDTVEEAIEARNWAYFPPLGKRSNGGGQAFGATMWGSVPGGYRQTINDNIVLILMIETLEGLKNAEADREGARRHRGVRGQRRPRQLLRLPRRASPTTSAPSTSCTTRRSRPASGCAVRSRGATGPTSPVFRPAAKRPLSQRRGRRARQSKRYARKARSGPVCGQVASGFSRT